LRNERGPPVERPDPGHQDKAAASALEIERYYFSASRRVKAEIAPPVAATTG